MRSRQRWRHIISKFSNPNLLQWPNSQYCFLVHVCMLSNDDDHDHYSKALKWFCTCFIQLCSISTISQSSSKTTNGAAPLCFKPSDPYYCKLPLVAWVGMFIIDWSPQATKLSSQPKAYADGKKFFALTKPVRAYWILMETLSVLNACLSWRITWDYYITVWMRSLTLTTSIVVIVHSSSCFIVLMCGDNSAKRSARMSHTPFNKTEYYVILLCLISSQRVILSIC